MAGVLLSIVFLSSLYIIVLGVFFEPEGVRLEINTEALIYHFLV
jgi:hypothetical protein